MSAAALQTVMPTFWGGGGDQDRNGGLGETGGEKNFDRAIASSAQSLSSSAPVAAAAVVVGRGDVGIA